MTKLRRLWCRVTRHAGADKTALGSIMSPTGPRFAYQCQRCAGYFTEAW